MKWLQGAVVLVAAAHFLNMLANSMLFAKFAFGDNGWPLTTDALLDDGLNPVADFGYFYGLLTLVVDRAAFALFGRTPNTVMGIYAICTLAVAIGMARTLSAVKMRLLPSLFLISCAALSAIPRGFPSPAHALEAALLMTALAEHAAGRLHRSLALVTLAAFVKPSLGYVYGVILIGLILSEASRWKRLLPAAFIGAALLVALTVRFGWEAVVRTQLPFDAMKAYEKANFGFCFGSGRPFWLPANPEFDYYFGGVAAVWLLSSAVLGITALRLLPRFREPAASLAIACAILHFTFVFVLFGNEWSWIYYTYILFVGTAVSLNHWPRWIGGLVALGLLAVSVCGQYEWLWRRDAWTRANTVRSLETAELPAAADQATEWGQIRVMAAKYPEREKVLLLTRMGCPQLLAPELDGPHWWCLIQGFSRESELDRARQQISKAEWIVSPDWHDNNLMDWPELKARESFEEVALPFAATGQTVPFKFFKLYRRKT